MRKQEEGIWHGGMLAVRSIRNKSALSPAYIQPLPLFRMKWGESRILLMGTEVKPDYDSSMGKTIQIIALLVSDRRKPNLVVA